MFFKVNDIQKKIVKVLVKRLIILLERTNFNQ